MLEGTAAGVTLDVCQSCHMVWFDAGEYKKVPMLPERGVRTLPQEALEKIARQQATVIAAEYKIRFGRGMSVAEALPLVPGIAGLPLESEPRGLSRWPLVTWALAALLLVLGLWSLAEPGAVEPFGLDATNVDRFAGATLVTALFVHNAWFQLATNVYFLILFGDNVEDLLGPATFGLLLFSGGVAGNALHAVLDANEASGLAGASGVVSAIVVFYAVSFPNARLRVIRLFRWHTVPAVSGLLLWLFSKLASTHPFFGRAEPSAWPYVGGALTGLVFWLVLRDSTD